MGSVFDVINLASQVAGYVGYLDAKKNLNLLLDEEEVILQKHASWQVKSFIIPSSDYGSLQLTNKRLRFLSAHSDYISYFLTDVASVTFKNLLGVIPQGLTVEYSDGRKELYCPYKREKWMAEILNAKAKVGLLGEPERTADGKILDVECMAIRQNLSRHFSHDELKSLCFDFEVDHDNLAGDTKDEKARELVGRLDSEGKLSELLKKCKELRPNAEWC